MKTPVRYDLYEPADLSAGVDWLTMTCGKLGDRDILFSRAISVRTLLENIERQAAKKFYWRGYDGWSIGGMDYGERNEETLLRLHGAAASSYWKLFVRLATNVSRVDLQTTFVVDPPMPHLVSTYYNNLHPSEVQFTRVENTAQRGQTLYVGSRSSDVFGRIYDKGVQSGVGPFPGHLWRYELEYKNYYAPQAINRLLVEKCNRRTLGSLITNTIYTFFDQRNLPPLFNRRGDADIITTACRVRSDELVRQLDWLRTQVSPTVKRLWPRNRTDVLLALGLEELDPDLLPSNVA